MSLTWSEIDARWPDAGVAWDALGAPFEARFVANDIGTVDALAPKCGGMHWAITISPDSPDCGCLRWDGDKWIKCWTVVRDRLWPEPSWRNRVATRCARLLDRSDVLDDPAFAGSFAEYPEPRHVTERDIDRTARWIAYRITQTEGRPNRNILPM